jgi:IS30 family transposase
MNQYQQLSSLERLSLFLMRKRGDSLSYIAQYLNRHRSTLYRELKRNHHPDRFYCPQTAGRLTRLRRQRPSPRQTNPSLRKYVERCLNKGWSPEIIAGRMKNLRKPFSVCTETLYRLIYSSHGRNRAWPQCLNLAKPKRGAIQARNRTNYLNFRLISERPKAISERCEFGHWEGDSVHFTQSKNQRHVTTLVERKSRFAIGILQPSTLSKAVMTSIKNQLSNQPLAASKSLTIDQGTEFSYYQILERVPRYGRRSIKTYYCNPKSPWQKGSIENFNLRLRKFLPRNFDIKQLTVNKLNAIIRTMNRTPRKCLDFKTPHEVYTLECRTSR